MSSQQDQSSGYSILAFVFDSQYGARNALDDLKSSGALDGYKIEAQVDVEHDVDGKIHFHEPGRGGVGTSLGAVTGGLLGLIGGPAGLLAWALAGGVIGGVAGHYLGQPIARGDLKEIGEALQPGTSALLMLLEDKETEGVIQSMEGYSANVVTLTAGNELSGQIAAFVAGAAQGPSGDAVAGASGAVAADG